MKNKIISFLVLLSVNIISCFNIQTNHDETGNIIFARYLFYEYDNMKLYSKADTLNIQILNNVCLYNVKKGIYTLEYYLWGKKYIVNNIPVSGDSITVVSLPDFSKPGLVQYQWNKHPLKIKPDKIVFSSSISGKIIDGSGKGIPGVSIYIKRPWWWSAVTDNNGYYLIDSVFPGNYELMAWKDGYHRSEFIDVKIAEDSVTILDILMIDDLIPEKPDPIKPNYKILKK